MLFSRRLKRRCNGGGVAKGVPTIVMLVSMLADCVWVFGARFSVGAFRFVKENCSRAMISDFHSTQRARRVQTFSSGMTREWPSVEERMVAEGNIPPAVPGP